MTEDDAREWLRAKFDVSRETRLDILVKLLVSENEKQNLIAPSTVQHIWARHIADSAQLVSHAPDDASWLDIGSGAGLPGLVIAALRDRPVELVEPRPLRTAFLRSAIEAIGLANTTVVTAKVERTQGIVDVITARAVTHLDKLFRIASHRADMSTIWILPKGRNADLEVEVARHAWHGSFHIEPSITAPDSLIVVAREVRPR